MNTVESIKAHLGEMTKSERITALFFLKEPSAFLFSTLEQIAGKIGVSTTSVLRFCRKMGFDGFKPFQNCIRKELHRYPSLTDKYQRTAVGEDDEILERTVGQTLSCVRKTFEELDQDRLEGAVKLLLEARRVFTFGMKESFALSHYAYTRLQTVRKNVLLCDTVHQGQIEVLLDMTPGDVCLFFLFPRYTKQATRILEAMVKRGVTVLLVTDPEWDKAADGLFLLPCYVDAGGIKNSAAAPVFLMDYLCNVLAGAGGEETLCHMRDLEELFSQVDILK